MDKLLRPERFDTEPTAPNAEKLYKHWKFCFGNYLQSTSSNTPENAQQKFFALANSVSALVFDIISDCGDFDSALVALDSAYIKPTNVVYNRHQLMTQKQQPSQSIDGFMQQLDGLAKNCNFQSVSADEYRQQYTRDAFISGISSASIRQRLLEKSVLTLAEAYEMARSLEQAEKQSATYESGYMAPVARESDGMVLDSVCSVQKQPSQKKECWFCGWAFHRRSSCPARNSECKLCGKKGHCDKVCRSQSTAPIHEDDIPVLA